MLCVTDGLFFVDKEVIDLASSFYAELISTGATFGEDSIKKLVPHISSLVEKLNNVCKKNTDLRNEGTGLQDILLLAESFKNKSVAYCELEDQLDTNVASLTVGLDEFKAEKLQLKERMIQNLDMDSMMRESEENIAALPADRQRLLAPVEVLEADIKCLRRELEATESQFRKRKSSVDSSNLLAELGG